MKILFLISSSLKPRIAKRVKLFSKGNEVRIVGVLRENQDSFESPYADISQMISIDFPDSSHLIKRYLATKKYQTFAVSKIKDFNPDILYATSFDSLLIAKRYKKIDNKVKVVYEIGDIREWYIEEQKGILKRAIVGFLKGVEKNCFRIVDRMVLTSEKFYDEYYCNLIEKEKVFFFPNVPEESFFSEYKKKSHGPFTVGFIGAIRYLEQMKMLIDVACECGINVLFAGTGSVLSEYTEMQEYAKDKDNVRFTGKYNYERDISKLYGSVDCIYSVYDSRNPNVKIALPNKLYESILCCLPIIVSKDTYLGEIVTGMGVGKAIVFDSRDELKSVLVSWSQMGKEYQDIVLSCEKNRDYTDISRYNEGLLQALYSLNR